MLSFFFFLGGGQWKAKKKSIDLMFQMYFLKNFDEIKGK